MITNHVLKLEELNEEEKLNIAKFEFIFKKEKRRAIWKGCFTIRYLGWRDAPICEECDQRTRFIFNENDTTAQSIRMWMCDKCNVRYIKFKEKEFAKFFLSSSQ